MTQSPDNETAYGADQDREPPQTAPGDASDEWAASADRNPDDFDADEAP